MTKNKLLSLLALSCVQSLAFAFPSPNNQPDGNTQSYRKCLSTLNDLGASALTAMNYCLTEANQNDLGLLKGCIKPLTTVTGMPGLNYCLKLSNPQRKLVPKSLNCLEDLKKDFLDTNYFLEESFDKGAFILGDFITYCQKNGDTKLTNPYVEFKEFKIYGNNKRVNGSLLGGLSGLTYDAQTNSLLTISDDPGLRDLSRFFEFHLDTKEFYGVKKVATKVGSSKFKTTYNIDAEGITLLPNNLLAISSETLLPGSNAFLRIYDRGGCQKKEILLSDKFLPKEGKATIDEQADLGIFGQKSQISGVTTNRAFEALTSVPGKMILLTANEAPLAQDEILGKKIVRIVKLATNAKDQFSPKAEFAYPLENVEDNGLVEMAALDENRILTLERSFNAITKKNTVRIYEVNLAYGRDYKNVISFRDEEKINPIETLKKKIIIDLDEVAALLPQSITIDNFEGMVLGPVLPNGKRSLILTTDNNFNARQFTQLLFLELSL